MTHSLKTEPRIKKANRLHSLQSTHVWKWPVVKYKHIKIKPRICILFILCLTWTVNSNSLKQNIIVIKEMFFLAATLVGWIEGDFVCRKVAAKNISGRNRSSGVLIMSLSVIVPEKSHGNKKCDKEEEERHIFGLFSIAVKWPWHGCMQLFWYLYVHSVEDSTLMPIFDHFCFSFVFLGLPKIGPNRYT